MPKEYRTIQEVAGPLMLVRGVENVTYDELGEIELASGETRRCKVLEINGSDALVQLFENSTVSTFQTVKSASSEERWSWAFRKTCWAVYSTVWAGRLTAVLRFFRTREEILTACR